MKELTRIRNELGSCDRGDGFTLIELMVALTVLGILAVLAAPSFEAILVGSRITSAANSLAASAILARSEAIKRNASVTLCVSANGTACTNSGSWSQGWIVLSGTTLLSSQSTLPSGISLTESSGKISLSFASTLVGSDAGHFVVCSSKLSNGAARNVDISATGTTTLTKATTNGCL